MLPKFNRLYSKLLFESPDRMTWVEEEPDIEEDDDHVYADFANMTDEELDIWEAKERNRKVYSNRELSRGAFTDEDIATTFGIIKDTIFYSDTSKFSTDVYTHGDLFIDIEDYITTPNRRLKQHTFGEKLTKDQLKKAITTQLASKGFNYNFEEIDNYVDGRDLFNCAGRIWADDKSSSNTIPPAISFWCKLSEIKKSDWSLIKRVMRTTGYMPRDFVYQFIDSADVFSYGDIFKERVRTNPKTSNFSDDKIIELKRKAHLIGGKWGRAMANL